MYRAIEWGKAISSSHRAYVSEASSDSRNKTLVARISGGDRSAEGELVSRYGRGLRQMLRKRTGDFDLADDLFQDTFQIVIERVRNRGLDQPDKLASFIHRTAVNLVIGDARKTSRRATYSDNETVYAAPDERIDSLGQLLISEKRQAIRVTIDELKTPRDREILHRSYVLDQDKAVVCSALDLSSEHFDRVISRARSRFRDLFESRLQEIQQ